MSDNISIIIPSFHSKALTEICIKSFKRFCPNNILLRYIVIENSNDTSYKDSIINMDSNIKWINNNTRLVGSEANAQAIEVGLKYVDSEIVMLCHNDVCVTSADFLNNLVDKHNEGFKVVGTQFDNHPNRIKALHISGLLINSDLSKKVNYMPHYKGGTQILDVGDEITQYCRQNKIETYCYRNTYNNQELLDLIDDKYKNFKVDRCIDDNNNVIFMHLGRGIPKTNGTYQTSNKAGLNDWVEFYNNL